MLLAVARRDRVTLSGSAARRDTFSGGGLACRGAVRMYICRMIVRPASWSTASITVEAIERDGTNPETEKAHRHDMRFLNIWHQAKFGTALPLPTPVSTVIEAITWHLAPDAETDAVLVADGVKRWPGPAAMSTLGRRLAGLSVAHKGLPSNLAVTPGSATCSP